MILIDARHKAWRRALSFLNLVGGGGRRRTSPKNQHRAHARNRKICSTLHNHKSRRKVTITNRFIAAIERKLLQIEFAANVAGLTFYLYKAHLQGRSRHVDDVALYKFYRVVIYTQIAKKLTPSILHSHIAFFSFFLVVRTIH